MRPFNGHFQFRILRLLGLLVAGGGLTVSLVVCHLATGRIPAVLSDAFLVVVGAICREAIYPEAWHPFPQGREPPHTTPRSPP